MLTLYEADTSPVKFQKNCFSISETKSETKYSGHKKSFKHEKHKNDVQLSKNLEN